MTLELLGAKGLISLPVILLSARGVAPFQKRLEKCGNSAIVARSFPINQQPLSYYLILKQKTHNQLFFDSVKDKSS